MSSVFNSGSSMVVTTAKGIIIVTKITCPERLTCSCSLAVVFVGCDVNAAQDKGFASLQRDFQFTHDVPGAENGADEPSPRGDALASSTAHVLRTSRENSEDYLLKEVVVLIN